MTYAEKLKDPRWQKRRLEIMERDEWTCQWCATSEKSLNVDHKIYIQGRDPWNYNDDDLQTLCEDCHKNLTKRRLKIAHQVGRMEEAQLCLLEEFLRVFQDNLITIVGVELYKDKHAVAMSRKSWDEAVEVMSEYQKNCKSFVEAKKTPNGGWTKAQLAEWGVPWPPPKGWRKNLEKNLSVKDQG